MDKKVNVILSTYNGSRYVGQLLDSILEQDYSNIKICIRDDGSTDGTQEILREYAEKHSNIFLINENNNLGVPNCFYRILKECNDADYYAFADQDDIWDSGKISRAVNQLEELDNSDPNMYCATFNYVDNRGMVIRQFELPSKVDIYNTLYYTPALGFTLVFNETLRRMAVDEVDIVNRDFYGELHDRRLIRIAAIWGNVICDNFVCAQHIRHDEAVTSADSTNSKLFINWIRKEFLGNELELQKAGIQSFYDDYYEIIKNDDKRFFSLILRNNGRLQKTFYKKRFRQRMSGEIILRIMFALGRL